MTGPRLAADVLTRFMAKVDQDGPLPLWAPFLGPCWLWTSAVTPDGYAGFWLNGEKAIAHRLAYELFVGPIPVGLQLDHLCRVRPCVNPAHLEPVTSAENTERGIHYNSRKAECKRGHVFTTGNTRVSRGRRICRTCERERMQRVRSAA